MSSDLSNQSTQKKVICIIEDEMIIAHDIADMLRALGHEVSNIIVNGYKALDYLTYNTPDLVLCDINIKGTIDGIDVANKIRKKKKLPFIFLTSLSDKTTIQRARVALPYGYIIKPFDENDLRANVEIALFKFQEELNSIKITKAKVDSLCNNELTPREYDIVHAMIQGKTYHQISNDLGISLNTIKYHTKHIYAKVDMANRAELMQNILLLFADVS